MSLITKVTTVEELEQIFFQKFFNTTDKVTKISDNSVIGGIGAGCAKVAQKALKDIAIIESHLLPESAFGIHLDIIAQRLGISSRLGALGSSTYIRLVGDVGTVYNSGIHTFKSLSGITFTLSANATIPDIGYMYVKVSSQEVGLKTNIDALTLNKVNPIPSGHKYVINEYKATGGRDIEGDEMFLKRIQEGPNILGRGTLAYLTQVFLKVNPNILRTLYQGVDTNGQNTISIVTQNGATLDQNELDALLEESKDYLSIVDLKPYSYNYIGLKIINAEWYPIDVSMRLKLGSGVNPDEARKEMQISYAKYLDPRFWETGKKVEWDNLLELSKSTKGVEYVLDTYFSPGVDIVIPNNQLPRIRSFLLLNSEGNILSNISGTLNPLFYPLVADVNFQNTVL